MDLYRAFPPGRAGRPRKGETRDHKLTAARSRLRVRLRRYGLDPDSYLAWLHSQNGVCALCKKPPKRQRLHVDHDHKTGKVRGLLCYRCNRYLVGFHTKETALSVYTYLSRA